MNLIKKTEELLEINTREIKEFKKENDNFNFESMRGNLEIASLLRLIYVRYRLSELREKRDRLMLEQDVAVLKDKVNKKGGVL